MYVFLKYLCGPYMMYVCTYVLNTYVQTYIHEFYAGLCAMCACITVSIWVYWYIYIYLCACICLCVHMYIVYVYMCMQSVNICIQWLFMSVCQSVCPDNCLFYLPSVPPPSSCLPRVASLGWFAILDCGGYRRSWSRWQLRGWRKRTMALNKAHTHTHIHSTHI